MSVDTNTLKMLIREADMPFFSDEELAFYLSKYNNDVNITAYKLLVIKSQDTTLQLAGMTTADTASYFLRLANMHRPRNTGNLIGG